MFKILVGMSLLSVVVEFFLSDSRFKKYIRAIVGILFLSVIIEGVFSTSVFDDCDSLIREAEKLSERTVLTLEKEIVDEYESDIKRLIEESNIKVENVKVRCDENLILKSVNIRITEAEDEKKVNEILKNEMGIDERIIIIDT